MKAKTEKPFFVHMALVMETEEEYTAICRALGIATSYLRENIASKEITEKSLFDELDMIISAHEMLIDKFKEQRHG